MGQRWLAIVAIGLWMLTACQASRPAPQAGPPRDSDFDYPLSMRDFVDRSEVIVRGTVVKRSFLGWTTKGYGGPGHTLMIEAPDAQSIRATPYIEVTADAELGRTETLRLRNSSRGWLPFTAYTLHVDQVYKAGGSLTANQEIVLHKLGSLDSDNLYSGPTPPLAAGSAYMFALVLAPDGVAYSQHFAGASCLALGGVPEPDDDEVYELWNEPRVVGFTRDTRVEDFLAAMEHELTP